MSINSTNYERYFIDLIDGKLVGSELDAVLDFIRKNPTLADELIGIEKMVLQPTNSENIELGSLLKSDFDQPDVFEDFCIRAIENELSENEKALFLSYLDTNKNAQNEFSLYQATILTPDESIVFNSIESLKHKGIAMFPIWYSVAAAMLLGFVFWLTTIDNTKPAQQAVIPQPKVIKNPKVPETLSIVQSTHKDQVVLTKTSTPKTVTTNNKEAELLVRSNEKFETLTSKLDSKAEVSEPLINAALAPVKSTATNEASNTDNQAIYPTIPEYLALQVERISIKEGIENLGKAALRRLSKATNEKLDYKTNEKGKVSQIEFNSKLLAFTIPVNQSDY